MKRLMGKPQDVFLEVFRRAFEADKRFNSSGNWMGGQVTDNKARLIPAQIDLRRGGKVQPDEKFELGDLRKHVGNWTLIVEYDQKGVSLLNLLKFWPYVMNENPPKAKRPILICHFSDWETYGSYRDLWHWVMQRIETDSKGKIRGNQFDNGGKDDEERRKSEIKRALNWIGKQRAFTNP